MWGGDRRSRTQTRSRPSLRESLRGRGSVNCKVVHITSLLYPLSGALPLLYVPARVTHGALVAHRHSFAPPRCRTSQYRRTFVLLSVSLWNNLSDPVFDGVGLAGFKSRVNAFLLA